jgi:hypothetical protein
MIFFVALVEFLLFFVLLQPQLIERSGAVAGILITTRKSKADPRHMLKNPLSAC